MSKQVDERVVEMRFDNKQFESATKESMSTLDKLKQKLQLKDAAKGLDNLEKAAKKVDLNPLGKSVDTVTAKFSAMQVAGATAIANLTNSAVNAGKNITKALTIEPVTTGFQEYETQIGSIQTILANTQKEGTNVERVNAALDELNTYADQTIYNFTEMTRNIGTFTAAGVKLDDSVSAIKGIANLAAVSGSTSQQASTAMYQLSQALAAGKVSLMDWNSVVNAGMGGQVFQDALIRTSENLKTGAKQAIATYGTFRESLTKSGWLTKEVLTETLGQLAGAYSEADLLAKGYSAEQAKEIVKLAETAKSAATDVKTFTQLWDTLKEAVQSGWGQTWRMIVGDFDEAKERMTKLSKLFGDIIEKSSNRRNSMLSGALDSSWKQLNNKLKNAGIETETFQNKIKELAKTHNVNLDEMIKQEGSFEKALRKAFSTGTLDKSILIDTIKSFVGNIKESADAAKTASNRLEEYGKIADKVIRGDFGNGAERIKKLTDAGYEYAAVQNIVNERLGSSVRHMSSLTDEQIANADSLATLSDEQLKSNGYTEEQIVALKDLKKEADDAGSSIYKLINGFEKPSGVELAWGSVFNILDSITESCKAVKQAWTEIFHPGMTEDQIIAERSERLYKLLESIHAFTEGLKVNEETAQKITRTFKGVFAILDLIRMVVGGALSIGFRVLKEVLSAFDMNVLDLTANIGDAIAQFHDWVSEHNLLAKAIQFVIPYVKQAVSAVSEWIKNNETIQNGINNLRSAFNNATKGLRDWVDNIKEADNIPKYIISGLVNGIKNGASLAVEAIVELGKSILEGIKGVLGIHSPSTKFFEIGSNMIAGLINGLKAAVSALLSFIGDIGHKCIDIISKIDFGKVFTLTISAGIIYSAKKLYELADKFAAPLEGLGKMFGSIGKMFNSAAKVLDNFSGMIKVKKYEAIAKMFLNLGIAIGIMAASVWVLSNIPDDKLWNAVKAVGALAAIFGVLAFAINKISGASASIGKDGVKISGVKTTLISLGIALLLMAKTVKMLGTLTPDEATHGFIGLTGLVVAIGLVLLAFGKLVKGKSAQNIDKFGAMLLKMSGALLLLMIVVKLIGRLSPEEMGKGTLFLAGFLVFINLFSKIANGKDSKSMKKVSDMLLKISGALLLMVVAVKLIGRLSLGEIVKGTLFLTGFLVFIKALMKVTEIGNDKQIAKISGLLLAISGALILMALACKLIGTLSLGDIGKGVLFVAGFLAFIKYLVKFTTIGDKQQIAKVAATILAMSVAIGILAAVSVLLGLVDLATLAKGVSAVTILGTIMTAMIWATKGAENVKGNIIAMTVAIGLMAASIAALSFIDTGKLAAATLALSMVMGMFALVEKMASNLSGAMGSMALLGLVVAELGIILGVMAYFDIQPSIETATSLSVLLLAMSGALGILKLVGAGGSAAFIGIGALTTLIAAIGGLMVGIGALVTYIPDMQTWLNTGMAVLEQIGYGLGSFFGNIVGGFLGGVSAGLPEIGTNISQFMLNMQPFFTAISGLDESSTNAVKALAETILILTGAGLIGGITSWLTGGSSLSSFGEQLVPFGEAIKEYGDAVAGINTSGIQQSVDAGKALAELANALPNSGGVAGFFAGENDIDEFAEKLVPFGKAIKKYGDTVAGINTSGIQQSVDAGKALSDLANALPNSGGVAGFFAGENDMDEFGEQLVTFGESITAYGETVANINTSGIQASVTAGHALAELADALPNSGGVAGFFAGNNDMDTFGSNLEKFGKSLVNFSNTVAGFNISGVTSKLSGFTKALTTLGKTGVDGFVKSFSDGSSKITSAAQKTITTFVNAAKGKQSSMTSAFKNMMSMIVSTIRETYSSYHSSGEYIVQGFADGIDANTYLAIAKARAMANAAKEAAREELNINSPSKVFMSIGKSVGEGFEKGISDKSQTSRVISSTVGLAGKVISSACDTLGINSPSRAFMAIGRYIGEGLAQGIRDSAWQAVYWTEDTAQKVIAVASKTFEDVEKWVEDAKAFDELSLAEELEIWEAVIEKYGEGTEERTKAEKKAYSVYKELQKENYENSKNWIDAEKEYNRLSLQEELEAWQRVQARYIEGTDERKEADKQVYKLKHELIDNSIEALEQEIELQNKLIATLDKTTNEYRNAVKERQHLNDLLLEAQYKNSTSYVEEKDFYGRERGLVEKLGEQWRIMTLRTKKGSDEYKKAAKEVYSIMKDMYNAEQEYLDDKAEIEKNAAKESEQLEKDKNDKIKEIRKQRDEDIQAADKKYNDELNSRTKALYDSYGLFDEVTEKETVNSATLMKNIQDQVDEFKDWQSVLNSLSARGLNEGLIEELQEMGPSAISEIKALNSMSDSQLQQYATLWSEKHKLAKNKAIDELRDLRTSTNSEIKNLRITAENEIQAATNLYYSKLGELNDKTEGQLFELKTKFEKTVGIIRTDTDEEFTKMAESAKSILTQAGKNMALGLVDGFGSQEGVIYDTIKNVLKKSEKVAKEVTDEHSPSKVYMGIGRYMVEGLVNGIENLKDKAVNTVGTLGHSMINSISSSISRISDVIKSDMDIEPTITPVIDLTNVRNGIGMINGAFGANRSMNLGMAIAANNQNGNSYQSELFGKMQDMADKANGKLTSAIDSLRSDFNDMASKLERMQVVLDSGALVGEIAPDMDSALGGLAKMNRRGVR